MRSNNLRGPVVPGGISPLEWARMSESSASDSGHLHRRGDRGFTSGGLPHVPQLEEIDTVTNLGRGRSCGCWLYCGSSAGGVVAWRDSPVRPRGCRTGGQARRIFFRRYELWRRTLFRILLCRGSWAGEFQGGSEHTVSRAFSGGQLRSGAAHLGLPTMLRALWSLKIAMLASRGHAEMHSPDTHSNCVFSSTMSSTVVTSARLQGEDFLGKWKPFRCRPAGYRFAHLQSRQLSREQPRAGLGSWLASPSKRLLATFVERELQPCIKPVLVTPDRVGAELFVVAATRVEPAVDLTVVDAGALRAQGVFERGLPIPAFGDSRLAALRSRSARKPSRWRLWSNSEKT